MNPLTQIKNTQKATLSEVRQGLSDSASWHAKFSNSAYVFAGGLSFDLTEGDVLAVFSQYGEIVDVNLVRHEETGKSRGFAFVCYEDQRATVLAVDNLNGATVLGRTIKVDHVEDYKLKDEEAAKQKDWKCGCGGENFKFRDTCFKCGGPRPPLEGQVHAEAHTDMDEKDSRNVDGGRGASARAGAEGRRGHEGFKHDERVAEDERPAVEEGSVRRTEAWEGAAFKSQTSEEDEMIKALKARKGAAMARARAAADGLPIPGGDGALEEAKKEAKRSRKEAKKSKKDSKKERKASEMESKGKKGGSRSDDDNDGLGSSSEEDGAVPVRSNGHGGRHSGRDYRSCDDDRGRSRSRSRDGHGRSRGDHREERDRQGDRDKRRDQHHDGGDRWRRDRDHDHDHNRGSERRDRR